MSRMITRKSPATCREFRVSMKDVGSMDAQDIRRMIFLVHLIRDFEQTLLDLQNEGLIYGPVHSSIGQEAIAAAAAVVLDKQDLVGSSHRPHGHFLAKAFMHYAPAGFRPLEHAVTADLKQVVYKTLTEIMGLADGWCGGRGGSMHLYDERSGNLGSNGIVGGGIPMATGAAWAEKLQGRSTITVSFFGDGAINQGCFHEVANMAALWRVPVVFFVENNHYAVGTKCCESSFLADLGLRGLGYGMDSFIVDGMDPAAVYLALGEVVRRMRRNPFPFLIEARTYRFYHHSGGLPGSAYGYRTKDEEAAWRAQDPATAFPGRLEEAGLLQAGENDALRELAVGLVREAVDAATAREDGRLIVPAAKLPSPASLADHLRAPACPLEGGCVEEEERRDLKPMSFVSTVAAVTMRSMEKDPRVVVLGEEVANFGGGAYQATKGIPARFPERIFNTPISECGFVGMAGGAAARGLRPVVEIMFPDFALVAADQLFNQIGKLRHMFNGQVKFPLLVRACASQAGFGGQHSMNPAGLFALFSGWRIMAPSTPYDYVGLFNTAMRLDDPVVIIEHRGLSATTGGVPTGGLDHFLPYGQAKVVHPGADLTVLTYLTGVGQCLSLARELAGENIGVEVIDLRTLDYLGLDHETIGRSVAKTNCALIVDPAPLSQGIAARLSAEIHSRSFDHLDCPVRILAGVDVPPPVSRPLEAAVYPGADEIRAAMREGAGHRFR